MKRLATPQQLAYLVRNIKKVLLGIIIQGFSSKPFSKPSICAKPDSHLILQDCMNTTALLRFLSTCYLG